jgi:ABC-2 type transport system permease protein
MTGLVLPARDAGAAAGLARLRLLVGVEYKRIMQSRVAWLLAGLMVYTVLVIPFILTGPQEEFTRLLAGWIGHDALDGKIILFIRIDAAMNKLSIIMGAVLGGGIIADEKARGSFDILLSKPVAAGDYFLAKWAAALLALATFYVGGCLLALATFPFSVAGFPAADFAVLSAIHLFAALFSAGFAAMLAAATGNRLLAMLTSVVVVGMLVGFAFVGFYFPAIQWAMQLNPFFHGVKLIGLVGAYTAWDVLGAIAVLIGFNLVVAAIGRWRAIVLIGRG